MKAVHILTARDRVALVNAARTLARITGELAPSTDGAAPRRRKKLNVATKRAIAGAKLRQSLRDVPEPAYDRRCPPTCRMKATRCSC